MLQVQWFEVVILEKRNGDNDDPVQPHSSGCVYPTAEQPSEELESACQKSQSWNCLFCVLIITLKVWCKIKSSLKPGFPLFLLNNNLSMAVCKLLLSWSAISGPTAAAEAAISRLAMSWLTAFNFLSPDTAQKAVKKTALQILWFSGKSCSKSSLDVDV